MIYPDHALFAWAENGGVTPFDPENVNPASIDLRLGKCSINLHPHQKSKFKTSSLTIWPGEAILASTIEYIKMPKNAAGVVYLKSSLARLGLDHALAGWVDPGFEGQLTMELHAHRPITLHAGQPIIQLVLMKTDGPVSKPYDGKYQGQRGPTEAR
jgi:dCTP deaminase